MRIVDSLEKIRSPWLSKISRNLARGEGVRDSFLLQLNRFFEMLEQAVETGDPSWMDPVLEDWVEARTQTELESRQTSLPPILDVLLIQSVEILREVLSESDALELVSAILPVFTHAYGYVTRKETDLHIDHMAQELEKTKNILERLDKSKSDFISIAAHELKTPLTLIEGYTAMLKDNLPEENEALQLPLLLKGMDNGTRRLREIIDDMIDVSMIDNQLLSLNYQPIWINRLLHSIQQEFEQTVQERFLSLEILSFPGSDEMSYGDGERLYQALRNVILNAIKFTPDHGKVVVDGRRLPGFVEITVTDTGIGIDPEDHLIIFEKFGRLGNISLHSSGKTKFKGGGPGLGLPITRGIIEAHGGAIWVESDGYDEVKCPGTTFHILLPIRKEAPDDKSAKLFQPTGKTRLEDSFGPMQD